MHNSEDLYKVIAGAADAETRQAVFSAIEEDHIARDDYNRLKNAWALLASEREMSPYQVEELYLKFREQLNSRNKPARLILPSLFKYAAIFILAIGMSSLFFYYQKNDSENSQSAQSSLKEEISTNFGTRTKFKLTDGTVVHLNSGSKLVFPREFKGNSRTVELSGEAFFEVTPNAQCPFVVKTSTVDIKVLGTSFNLKAYSNSDEVSTILVEGKVLIEKEEKGISTKIAELMPSERAVYNASNRGLRITAQQDLDKYIAWKDGKLVFSNDPIDELAEKIGIWYNVNVKIGSNDLKIQRFTATFTDEPIEQVLDLLTKSTPIKYHIKKAVKLSDNTFSKREIILY